MLGTIIQAMLEEDAQETAQAKPTKPSGDRHLRELRLFVGATRRAQEHGLPLHVSMAPPGHTDFGFYTVFPHCPACKAGARLQPWQRKYPTQLYPCQVCGTQYPPAETASSERMPESGPELRDTLGPERFVAFATSYLVANGFSASNAAEIVAATEAHEQERQRRLAADRQKAQRHERYVKTVLFTGLHSVHTDPSEDDSLAAVFKPDEFAELLRRCHASGIEIVYMHHESTDESREKQMFKRIADPQGLFAKWQKEGCNELFGAMFKIPDRLLDDAG